MITMRNIWIMMLGICLFGCGAGKQPGIFSKSVPITGAAMVPP